MRPTGREREPFFLMAGEPTGPVQAPGSHYERVGGAPALREAVDRFYTRVLADAELAPYFEGVNVAELKRHQVLLLSQVLGGPQAYDGRELGAAHAGLGITTGHYALVVGHLVAVFQELGVPEDVIAAAGEVVASVEPDIVERPEAPAD
jgi:hemoglobin